MTSRSATTILHLATQCLLSCMFALELSTTAWAQSSANLTLAYSGRLTDASGAPKTGPVEIIATFWSGETGGSQLSQAFDFPSVNLDQGIFSLNLTLAASQVENIFGDGTETVYIQITSGSTNYPRQRFSFIPLAMRVPVDNKTLSFDASSGRLGIKNAKTATSGNVLVSDGTGGVKWDDLSSSNFTAKTQAGADPAADQVLTYKNGKWVAASLPATATGGNYLSSLVGDVVATGPGTGTATLASVALPGTATKILFDAKGRVLSGTTLNASDITTALGYNPGDRITSLNGLTGTSQTLAVGTGGNSPTFNSSGTAHTLNIPLASAGGSVTAGLISNADYTNFSNKVATVASSTGISVASSSGTATVSLSNTSVTAGTYSRANITVDQQGRLTSAASSGAVNLASEVSGVLPTVNGGTGLSSNPSNGQIPIGNGSGYTLSTLTAGTGITISNDSGSVTVSATDDAATKVAKSGDTMTGALTLPADGLVAGAGQLVLAGGNVGIGTTAPLAALDVRGALIVPSALNNTSARPAVGSSRIQGEIAGSNAALWPNDGFLRLSAGGGTSASGKSFIDISGYSTVDDMNNNIVFVTSGVENMRIIRSGNVGIGTTTPAAALDVNGQIKIQGGTPGVGRVLTSDANGLASWLAPATGGTVTSVSGTAPISVATGSTTPVISMSLANTTTAGYLSAADWNTFNGKQAALAAATSVSNGFLASGDWVTFNNKQPAGNYITALTGDGTLSGFSAGSAALTLKNTGAAGTYVKVTTDAQGRVTSGVATIGNADIAAAAAIDATKIGGGGVTSAEFAFLGSVTSDIQTQLNNKVSSASPTFTGVVTIPLGAIATPSLTFTGDTNTGLWSPAADTVAFSAAGTEKLRILSNGNVGIGTTAPSAKLQVAGTAGIDGIKFPDGTLQISAAPVAGLVNLTDATTIAVNGSLGAVYKVTLGGNRTLANPTSLVPGAIYTFIFTQDATGGRTLTFGTNYVFPGAISTPALSATPGATDSAQFVSDGTFLYYISGFASAVATCLAPTNLSVSITIDSTYVTTNLTWANPSANLQNTIIQRSTDGVTSWTSLATIAAGTTSASYTDSDVTTDGYHWRVTANCGLSGTNSSLAKQGSSSVPGPTSVTRTPVSSTSATISWVSASSATGYELSRSIIGANTWSVIATPGSGATSYTDSGLALNVAYSYRIRALQGTNYSNYFGATTVCGTPAQFSCGTAGNDCYSNNNAVYGASAVTQGGRCLSMIYANGSSGFTVWKDQYSSNILSANGLDSWSMALIPSGKGQSTTPFSDANLGTPSTVLAGRACPTNVYISDSTKLTTGNCLYYTPAYAAQTLNAGGDDNGMQLGMTNWSSVAWYEGNIATCSSKSMRLPTLYEASVSDPGSTNTNKPDNTPNFNATNGVPSAAGWTWTSSSATGSSAYYWLWSGNTSSGPACCGIGYASWSNAVRCVLP